MFYSSKHAQASTPSPTRRRIAGVAVAGATVAAGSVATAQSASAAPSSGVWDAVAECESGGDWSISTGNGFYGGLQFTTQTWQGFGGDKYASNANEATKSQQIEIAQEVLKVQGPGAWPVCSQEAGLTEANGLAAGGGSTASADEAPAQEAPEQEAPEQEAPEQAAPAPQQERSADQGASRSEARTGSLAVDGVLGPKTHTAIEQWVGGSVDHGNTHLSPQDIEKLQANVGAAPTGTLDTQTTEALQEHVGAGVDGIWGSQTTSALQTHLNAQGL